jgi:hypothetical protein
MCNIFISLYDFAVGKGLLQREPEFGQQLQSTTERFLALAKASSAHEDSHDESSEESQKPVNSEFDRRLRGSRKSPKKRPGKEPFMVEPTNPYGGYIYTLGISSEL